MLQYQFRQSFRRQKVLPFLYILKGYIGKEFFSVVRSRLINSQRNNRSFNNAWVVWGNHNLVPNKDVSQRWICFDQLSVSVLMIGIQGFSKISAQIFILAPKWLYFLKEYLCSKKSYFYKVTLSIESRPVLPKLLVATHWWVTFFSRNDRLCLQKYIIKIICFVNITIVICHKFKGNNVDDELCETTVLH